VGFEEIGYGAFEGCVSLERIVVPSSVETIVQRAFYGCEHLVNVNLCEGLNRIDGDSFVGCKALERINIPASVRTMEVGVFRDCPSLVAIEFCSEIEDLVAASSLTDWYNHGRNKRWLTVYSCLKQLGIPELLTRIQYQRKWRHAIYDLLGRYPLVHRHKLLSFSSHIFRVLCKYIKLKDSASILELALWKSRIEGIDSTLKLENNNCSTLRSAARNNCGATQIIPNVLSFLVCPRSLDTFWWYCQAAETDEERSW
jgi:hypothetical protein